VSLKLHNNVALTILRANKTHTESHLEGDGEVIAVCDTGFDKGSDSDVHPAFFGRVLRLYSLGGLESANDPNGHGTHVAGSALGDGVSETMGGAIRGAAPKAKLTLQSARNSEGAIGALDHLSLSTVFKQPYEECGHGFTQIRGCQFPRSL